MKKKIIFSGGSGGFGKVFKYKVKIDNDFEKIINEYLKKQLYD